MNHSVGAGGARHGGWRELLSLSLSLSLSLPLSRLTLVDSAWQAKRDKAERLMESVTRLSALAREAAEVAAAQKIKAQVPIISN